MKISSIEVKTVINPLKKPLLTAIAAVTESTAIYVCVSTDEGLVGWGEAQPFAPVTGETMDTVRTAIEFMTPHLLGMDPFCRDQINAKMDALINRNTSAKCAIDLALWDILGKACGQPVYKLLGGASDRIVSDVTIGIDEPEQMAEDAVYWAKERGFRIIKVKAGLDVEHDICAIKAIRDAVGDEVCLHVDANQGYNYHQALRALKGFADVGVESVEQPLRSWDLEGHAMLRKTTRMPIMLDESVHSPEDAAKACRIGAADIINIKLMKCGGLTKAKQIDSIAASFGVSCIMGCMMDTRLAITAGASFAAASCNISDTDSDNVFLQEENPRLSGGFTLENDTIILQNSPGFGVTLDI